MKAPWSIESLTIDATKHFALGWMRKWGWTIEDLRDAIRTAYRIDKLGARKYEVYVQKAGYKKIITVYYNEENKLLCITGSQGGKKA